VRYVHEYFTAPAAKGAAYHAQFAAGGGAIDDAHAFTRHSPPRNVQAVLGVGGAAQTVTIDGTDYKGDALQSVLTFAGAGTQTGTKIFHTITRVRTSVDPGGTLDIQTGDAIGCSAAFDSVKLLTVANVIEATTATDATTGGFTPTSIPNAALNYHVVTATSHNHVQAAHTHVQAAHTHTLS
jgi:hypothetical protein